MAYEPTGLVVGKFAPFHNGHKLVIDTALQEMDAVIVLVYANPDFPGMPSQRRAAWIRQLYADQPVTVFTPEGAPPDSADDFTQREFVKTWLEAHQSALFTNSIGRIDVVYGSDAYIPGFASHIKASGRVVDAARAQVPTSGTALRALLRELEASATLQAADEEVFCAWNGSQLAELQLRVPRLVASSLLFWAQPVKRVVFLGAESTGKSTLAERLAREYNAPWVAEYGREVWERKRGSLELEDYVQIARHHRRFEAQAIEAAQRQGRKFVFVDTNAITTMFLGYAYEGDGAAELTGLARAAETRYHHVFLCDTDIPFQQDGWRDNDFWRQRAQGLIRYDLAVRGVPYTMLSGALEDRMAQVRRALES